MKRSTIDYALGAAWFAFGELIVIMLYAHDVSSIPILLTLGLLALACEIARS